MDDDTDNDETDNDTPSPSAPNAVSDLAGTQRSNPDFDQQSHSTSAPPPSSGASNGQSSNLTPEIGHSKASYIVETTQLDSFGVSDDDPFQVSFAAISDLKELSEIHARASIENPLACCLVHEPERFKFLTHVLFGRLHYGQAFGINPTAIALKVTDQRSKAIVGCALLRGHEFHNRGNGSVLISRPGQPIPSFVTDTYIFVHDEIHKYRRKTINERGTRESETLHYCEYR